MKNENIIEGKAFIISAFPATGKTSLAEKCSQKDALTPEESKLKVLDL